MIYLDTSVLVSALTTETATLRVQLWLKTKDREPLLISPWVVTEFSSALAMKLRLGMITPDDRVKIIHEFEYIQRELLRQVDVRSGHFLTASRFASQHTLGLRAADALHLAIAADNDATLCTLDQRLYDAARLLHLPCEMP